MLYGIHGVPKPRELPSGAKSVYSITWIYQTHLGLGTYIVLPKPS